MPDSGADPPELTPGRRLALESVRCSFCGKRGTEVASIVAAQSPAIAICNECVELCAEIMAEQRRRPDGPDPPP